MEMLPDRTGEELSAAPITARGLIAAVWGIAGIALLLGSALRRLVPIAWAPLRDGQLVLWQGAVYAIWVLFTAYAEGYRGFYKSFAPRCAARAVTLSRAPIVLRLILAPAYCMSLFAAARRRMIASWSLVIGITLLVMLVKKLPQPYRGIVDGGVVIGLAIGLAAVLYCAIVALRPRRAKRAERSTFSQ
jgi:hypothetical protein